MAATPQGHPATMSFSGLAAADRLRFEFISVLLETSADSFLAQH